MSNNSAAACGQRKEMRRTWAYRNCEGQGLAGPSFSSAKHIMANEGMRQGSLLDGRHLNILGFLQPFYGVPRQR